MNSLDAARPGNTLRAHVTRSQRTHFLHLRPLLLPVGMLAVGIFMLWH